MLLVNKEGAKDPKREKMKKSLKEATVNKAKEATVKRADDWGEIKLVQMGYDNFDHHFWQLMDELVDDYIIFYTFYRDKILAAYVAGTYMDYAHNKLTGCIKGRRMIYFAKLLKSLFIYCLVFA